MSESIDVKWIYIGHMDRVTGLLVADPATIYAQINLEEAREIIHEAVKNSDLTGDKNIVPFKIRGASLELHPNMDSWRGFYVVINDGTTRSEPAVIVKLERGVAVEVRVMEYGSDRTWNAMLKEGPIIDRETGKPITVQGVFPEQEIY